MGSYHNAMVETDKAIAAPSMLKPRLIGLAVALCCALPLVFAATLTPSSAGLGTHMQVGLPSCGFLQTTGMPCATCGCTTAFAHAADGSLLSSLITQPFGALLALGLAMTTLVALWSVWSAMPLQPLGQALLTKPVVFAIVGLLLVGWAYKAAAVAMGG